MRKIVFLIVVLSGSLCFGQKETLQVIEANTISAIQITANEVFKITIVAKPVKTITLKTKSSGEYYNNIGLVTQLGSEKLEITSKYQEKLKGGYDKLSAHKVFSMEIIIEIPTGLQVTVNSNEASVYCSGHYKNLFVQLKSGACYATNFTGNAVINTYSGNIELETKKAAVEAHSRHGKVEIASFALIRNYVKATTINGNISITKTN